MDIQLNDIALFVEVAKRKNFSHAAEALNIPTSTLSRRVSELERGLGMRLLNRSTRRIDLTEAGALYFERCRHIVEEARVAHEQLQDMAAQPKGRLRISLPTSLAQLFLTDVIPEFRSLYPDIECDFDLSMRPVDPISNPFDLVLRFGQQPDSSLVARQIVLMTQHLYAAPQYLALHGEPRVPADLGHHECLRPSMSDAFSYWVLQSGDKVERVQVSGRLAANNIGMLGRLASQGLGITPLVMSDSMTRAIRQAGLVRVLPDWALTPIPLFALMPSRMVPAKTRAFLDFIQPRLNAS
ncbi:LysR family transcriptional regulator [Bordetella bronchiseptica]|uniref:Probable LysR-family transcriptional regulator n=1 Tax=Bordetella bronchiseptica (strain ATCC BAA-588 / NCTC 13252 / RB50) TaxID=257310 RepID=A0A0H3LXF7_BORBR|nr:LysR family transcriptional regulator [Bordetella bronchiseptica]KAK66529.1 LysR substrate-binding domain protein [Bordetella bronchiseptica 980-2]AMG90456.1 LysR family transcriptional regulator [Bordetella bronchiseptica]KCV47586.1 LysR substrate-binding domain protein [Bordetella bronchiseptica 3E44]KCV64323.1 LysR substrate-binding domain protein [Bordetella bronchiseptica 980]KDB82908.1 LysR substrate-binding domain protein [Bordetella bronchiseptica D756]